MIPPEPEPDPPEPTVPAYTYTGHSTFSDGPYTADLYEGVKDSQGRTCYLLVRVDGSQSDSYLLRLAITDVTAFDQVNYYFCNADKSIAIYADNASIGGIHPYYAYDSVGRSWVQAGTAEVISSVPEDFFFDIKSGNFTLTQSQSRKGDIDESDLYDN